MSFMTLKIDDKWRVTTSADTWWNTKGIELYRHNELMFCSDLDNLHIALILQLYEARQLLERIKNVTANIPS